MQAAILAAGSSSRLWPLSESRHKSFVSIFGKPIIVHTIEAIKRAGVTDIIIITDDGQKAKSVIENEEIIGVNISYVVQKEALGMGDALLQAKDLLYDSFLVTSGYHVDADVFIPKLLLKKNSEATLLLKKRADYWKHGVVTVAGEKVISIEEKPRDDIKEEKLCIVGLYYLTLDFLETLKQTPTTHYHLETALNAYAKKKGVSYVITSDDSVSLKYPWDLLDIKNYLLKKIKKQTGKNCKIAKSAELIGDVFLGDNVKVFEGARIKGPCYIGNNAVIGTNTIIRNGTVIESNCIIGANMEIKNSLLLKGTTTHSGFIGDSVIGEDCKIAAKVTTANVRLDRGYIKATVKGEPIDTKRRHLGVVMGKNVVVGINCSIMPGVIVGNNVVIGPSTTVKSNISSNVTYYTKFKEVIKENNT